MKYGSIIRNIRESKGIKSSFVAKNLGMTVAGYRKIEVGEVDISLGKIEQIAPLIGITRNDLFEEFKKVS